MCIVPTFSVTTAHVWNSLPQHITSALCTITVCLPQLPTAPPQVSPHSPAH